MRFLPRKSRARALRRLIRRALLRPNAALLACVDTLLAARWVAGPA